MSSYTFIAYKGSTSPRRDGIETKLKPCAKITSSLLMAYRRVKGQLEQDLHSPNFGMKAFFSFFSFGIRKAINNEV